MSRDNDVFVYTVSKLIGQKIDEDASSIQSIFLIFHERSRSLLKCWGDEFAKYHSEMWIFIVWLSVCFGNDYAFEVFDDIYGNRGNVKLNEIFVDLFEHLKRQFFKLCSSESKVWHSKFVDIASSDKL